MKLILICLLCLSSFTASAYCNLNKPSVEKMVISYIKKKVKGDLKKAYKINTLSSSKYSNFAIQYKSINPKTYEEQVRTHMITVSCLMNGKPFIENVAEWAVPLSRLHTLD